MVCPKCGRENEDGKMICVECGCELKTIHIHSHKVKRRVEEYFALGLLIIFTVIAMYYTIVRFDTSYSFVSIALLLFEVFNFFVIYLVIRSFIVGSKLDKAYIDGNVSDASKYGIIYSGLKRSYKKLVPSTIIIIIMASGMNMLMKSLEDVSRISVIFTAVVPIAIIFISVGLVEMLRKS